jgi:hypothetical protein
VCGIDPFDLGRRVSNSGASHEDTHRYALYLFLEVLVALQIGSRQQCFRIAFSKRELTLGAISVEGSFLTESFRKPCSGLPGNLRPLLAMV